MEQKEKVEVSNENMIDGEKAYPIYRVETRLKYDGVDKESTSSDRIYPTEPTAGQLLTDVKEWWNSFLNSERIGENKTPIAQRYPILLELKISFIGYETWCLRWFSHCTYVNGRSDEELKQSFAKYVTRRFPYHNREEMGYCLMGAEDYWRWKEPCHCEDCQKHGITLIIH